MNIDKVENYSPSTPVEHRADRSFVVNEDPHRLEGLPMHCVLEEFWDEVGGRHWDFATGSGYYETAEEAEHWKKEIAPKQLSHYNSNCPIELRAHRYIHVEAITKNEFLIWEKFHSNLDNSPDWSKATGAPFISKLEQKDQFLASIPLYALTLCMNKDL